MKGVRMKSVVSSCLVLQALVFASVYLLCLPVTAETAQSAVPPGGTVTCESGQVASCTVKGGKVDGRCQTPPASMKGTELKAFVLSDLTGKAVSAEDVNKGEYKDALRQGHLGHSETTNGAVVDFKIPKELLKSPEPKE